MHRIKWGGLLPISSFGSRHCRGVATVRATACKLGVLAHTTEGLHARARGVPRKACRDRLPWVLCRDRGLLVATEMAHSVSR